jgi:hypothetical protein
MWYDCFNIPFVILWFLQSSVDCIEGYGKLLNIAIALIGIIDNIPEYGSRDGIDLFPSLWYESLNWDGGYYGILE